MRTTRLSMEWWHEGAYHVSSHDHRRELSVASLTLMPSRVATGLRSSPVPR